MNEKALAKMLHDIFAPCAQLSEEALARYVELDVSGQEAERQLPDVKAHLDVCQDCAAAYADLAALLRAEAQNQVQPSKPPRPFGFGFLSAPTPWRWEGPNCFIVEFSDDLLRLFQPLSRQTAHSRQDALAKGARRLDLKEGLEDLEVSIQIEETQTETSLEETVSCIIEIQVNIPSRGGWPNLAGTAVTLRRAGQELAIQHTDAYGQVVFEDIPTADLVNLGVEISPLG